MMMKQLKCCRKRRVVLLPGSTPMARGKDLDGYTILRIMTILSLRRQLRLDARIVYAHVALLLRIKLNTTKDSDDSLPSSDLNK